MEVVVNIFEVSSKLGLIQYFCEFSEDIHKIRKCNDDSCTIRIYNDLFNPELDDYRIKCFVKKSIEYHHVF